MPGASPSSSSSPLDGQSGPQELDVVLKNQETAEFEFLRKFPQIHVALGSYS